MSINQGYSYSIIADKEIEQQCQEQGVVVDLAVRKILNGDQAEFFCEMGALAAQRSEGRRVE